MVELTNKNEKCINREMQPTVDSRRRWWLLKRFLTLTKSCNPDPDELVELALEISELASTLAVITYNTGHVIDFNAKANRAKYCLFSLPVALRRWLICFKISV